LKNLEWRFPGFEKIATYRDDVVHGEIKHSLSISEVDALRKQAKAITDELLKIVNEKVGVAIRKNTPCHDVLEYFEKTHPPI